MFFKKQHAATMPWIDRSSVGLFFASFVVLGLACHEVCVLGTEVVIAELHFVDIIQGLS